MNENKLSHINEVQPINYRLQCIIELMDENISVFGRPSSFQDWNALFENGNIEDESDQNKINKASAMVSGIFRTAQLSLDAEPIDELFSQERIPEVNNIVPDELTMKALGDDHENSSSVAFAKSMTLYKKLVEEEQIDRDQLQSFAEEQLDALPGSSPLHLSLIETAKKIMRNESKNLLGI